MQRILLSTLACTMLCLGCGTNAPQNKEQQTEDHTSDMSNERASELLSGFITAFGGAWENGDPEGIAATFTEDGIRVIGGAQEVFNGRASIAASFGGVQDGEPLQNTRVEIVTTDARFVSEDLVIGCGYFKILNETNEILSEGKWGNTYRLEGDELLMLMESAYRSSDAVDEVANANAVQKLQPNWDCGGSLACAQVAANVAAFVSSFNAESPNELSMLFREDGIRSVSELSKIALGRESILETFQSAGGGVLSADMKGFRDVGNNLAVAHGQWKISDGKGGVAAFGQWGNIFETSETNARLVMESAGRFLVD